MLKDRMNNKITVSKLPVDNTLNAWDAMLEKRQPNPTLKGNTTADYLIIGGGFAGLAACKRLSQLEPNADVVLLEAKQIGQGPAGRNSGFMVDLPHDLQSNDYGRHSAEHARLEIEDNRTGIEFAREMARDASMPQWAFDPCGKYNGAASAKGIGHNLSYSKQLTELNEPHTVLDAKQMKEITGTDYYQHGLHTPGTVLIQPAAFVRLCADSLRSNQIRINENSPVVHLEQKNSIWIAKTNQGQVAAAKVILAVNGHLASFGIETNSVMHIFTYGSMSAPMTYEQIKTLGGHESWGITPADPLGTSVRKILVNGKHRILIRNRFTYEPSMEIYDTKMQSIAKDHDKAFRARFPMLKNLKTEHCWGGRLALTRNGVSVFGEQAPGLFSACIQNGLGTAKGTFQGKMAAEMACGIQSHALTRLLNQKKPQRLLPEPFMSFGATAFLRWSEWRAGKEI